MVFRLASLHNGISQFLKIMISLYTDTSYLLHFSGEPWLLKGIMKCLLSEGGSEGGKRVSLSYSHGVLPELS